MTTERWEAIRRLFEAALPLDPAGRVALLEGRCGADPALRREVELLLVADRAARDGRFLGDVVREVAARVATMRESDPDRR